MSVQLVLFTAGALLTAAVADARLASSRTPDPPTWPSQYQVRRSFSMELAVYNSVLAVGGGGGGGGGLFDFQSAQLHSLLVCGHGLSVSSHTQQT